MQTATVIDDAIWLLFEHTTHFQRSIAAIIHCKQVDWSVVAVTSAPMESKRKILRKALSLVFVVCRFLWRVVRKWHVRHKPPNGSFDCNVYFRMAFLFDRIISFWFVVVAALSRLDNNFFILHHLHVCFERTCARWAINKAEKEEEDEENTSRNNII